LDDLFDSSLQDMISIILAITFLIFSYNEVDSFLPKQLTLADDASSRISQSSGHLVGCVLPYSIHVSDQTRRCQVYETEAQLTVT
jgi:hypothetical protein